ncbi:MAG: HAMP domain-containing protein [Actinobacteria bacterium]|nr:HAMP domain-containing protein [Actinomycetota bacterium]
MSKHMENSKSGNGYRRKASLGISLRITAIVLTIFLVASVIGLITFKRSLDQLANNSKAKVVDSVASLVSSSHGFVAGMIMHLQVLNSGSSDFKALDQEFRSAIDRNAESPSQVIISDLLKEMVESGILGFEIGYFAVPPAAGTDGKPVIVASNQDEYIFQEVPADIAELLTDQKEFRLFEDGIPEMGLEGEYLVTSYEFTGDGISSGEGSSDEIFWYFDFKPMGDLLSGIDSFYQKESGNAMLALGLVMGLSIVGLLIISFLVLGYLIKKRITKPIEELSAAAEKVMNKDMEVRLEIHHREEFSGLKRVFNEMISSISAIVSKTLAEEAGGETGKTAPKSYIKPKSTILFQVIALFTIVFIAAGVLSMLSIRKSMDSLVARSKETLIETEGELTLSSHEFGSRLTTLLEETTDQQGTTSESSIRDIISAISSKTVSPVQAELNQSLRYMVEYGLLRYSIIYCILAPGPLTSDYLVIFSSDDKYMYLEPPEEILEFFDKDEDSFLFFPDGIPEMGLNEPYLATSFRLNSGSAGSMEILLVDFKPMGEQVEAINNFYDRENNKLTLTMGIVIGISILAMILITVAALTYLIRKQITGPIDELTAVANQVMEGDLDVQVKIRPGEELESLKIAFNRMISTLRDLVEQSLNG